MSYHRPGRHVVRCRDAASTPAAGAFATGGCEDLSLFFFDIKRAQQQISYRKLLSAFAPMSFSPSGDAPRKKTDPSPGDTANAPVAPDLRAPPARPPDPATLL